MAVPGLLRRMMTFASKETLCACVRVSWDWFDDAVAVLYNQMEVRVALGMGSKLVCLPFGWELMIAISTIHGVQ